MWAISVLGNAKSDCHRKTHGVELDGAGRKYMHLTRGELEHESVREVSRVRSSEEARRKAGGAKGRRVTKARPEVNLRQQARRRLKAGGVATAATTSSGTGHGGEWSLTAVAGLAVESKAQREQSADATQ